MRKAPSVIAALLAVSTAACVLSGNPKKNLPSTPAVAKAVPAPTPPPAPPAPLSIPQTQVELPRPQSLDPAALSSDAEPRQVEPADTTPASRPSPGRGRPATSSAPPRTETPAAPPPSVPVVPPATETAPSSPIQEIVPPQEVKRLQEQTQARRRDVLQILDQVAKRPVTTAQKDVITRINNYLATSLEAEKKGDMKLADAFADRAQILAKDLINGK